MAEITNTSSLFHRLVSGFLIGIFAFSITPVALLHDMVSNHKDVCYHNFQQKEKQISKADINCHCIDFVAEAQFLNTVSSFIFVALQPMLSLRNIFHVNDFFSQHHFFAELRGPPALA